MHVCHAKVVTEEWEGRGTDRERECVCVCGVGGCAGGNVLFVGIEGEKKGETEIVCCMLFVKCVCVCVCVCTCVCVCVLSLIHI